MSARRRVLLLVALAAPQPFAVVAAAVLSTDGGSATTEAAEAKPRPGRPPLSLALGFRDDPEARDLASGSTLYANGKLDDAAALFARHD